ncbi:phage tail spike protein [Alkalibacillus almallahensis]|uniref:phage tail spike protein n=1 Tax=Alkalibacillus almallahensis TaxID=1379154 RepID=UPI00142234F0|nr:phage tail spike protein [Alkalibacillus almallahensis]NIK12879.1 phage minor structural protein [Alkalibacillus almallahensis]
MSQIHILDQENDQILDVITKQHIIEDVHKQSLKDKLETFDFTTFANKRFSQYLEKRNRLIIPGEDGEYREFIMHEVIKDINRQSEVYAKASYLELKKQSIIYPQTFNAQSATQMVGHATDGTEWQPGLIEITNIRTFNVENHRNPFAFLKTIANEFDAELRFRIVTDGNRVVARYVDLLKRRGQWQGREVTSGKDLASIKRTERTDNVYTALVGIGPEREDGNRLEVLVEDQDALKRWGRRDKNGNLQHLIGTYEPQSTRQDMTGSELEQYTRTELNKRINAVVEFEADIVDLEHVPGLENKRFRFGDTIKIKDTGFEPPLYLEARIFEQERSIVDKSAKKVKLGDFTELTEEEVQNVWKQLQSEIAKKINAAETYDKTTIDSKDQTVFEDGKTFAEVQASNALEDAKADAKQKANEAQTAAEEYALAKANLAETEAEAYADGIVSDEEQARINQAEANLQEAKQHAETKASEAQSAAEAYTDTQLTNYVQATQYDSDISDIQAQIDNQITSHFKNYAPTLNNEPASLWTTDNKKDKHVGDLFYDTDTGYSYRFAKNNGTYEWIQVRDEGINKALQDASEAQDTADSKRRVFVSQPNTPYDKGDLWDKNGSIYRSTLDKSSSGSFSSADWVLIGDVTGEHTSQDTENVNGRPSSDIEDKQGAQNKADNAEQNAKDHADTVSDQALTDAQNYAVAQTAYDTKMDEIANDLSAKAGVEYVDGQLQLKQGEIPQQDTEPSNPNTGMLWLDTSQSPNVMKRYDGSSWVKASPTEASEVGSYTIAEVDNRLSNKVSVTQYDSDMDGVISDIQSNSTLIGQNEDAIALKADSSRVDTLEGTVSDHSSELNVMSDEISSKVEADYVEGEIDKLQVGGRNLLKGTSFTDGLGDTNGYSINLNISNEGYVKNTKSATHEYTSSKDNGEDSLNKGVRYRNLGLETNETYTFSFYGKGWEEHKSIDLYSQSSFDESITRVELGDWTKYILEISPNEVMDNLYIRPNGNDEYSYHLVFNAPKLEKGSKATDWTPAPEDTQSQIDDLDITVEQHSTDITQNANSITSKAEQSELDTLTGRVSTAESEITQNADNITSKVEQTEFNTLEGRVDSAESTIQQHADEIELRVEKNGVIGSINLSEENLKIDVEQVAIQGDLEVSEGNLVLKDGSVTAPKISSREITSEKLLLGNFDNMLENPNFLNNISPHDLQRGSWTLDNNKSHTGKTSLKCTGVDAGDEARVYLGGADAIVVQEGEQYQFSTHVIKTGNSPHSDMVISLRFADEDLNFVSFEGTKWFYSDDFSHNEWTQVTTTGTVPEGAFYVQPTIRIMDDGNNPSYQIDSVKLKSLVDGKLVAGTIESVDINGSTFTAQSGEDGYVRINDAGWYVVDGNDEIRIGINTKGQSWSQPAPSILWFFPNDNSSENYIGLQESDGAPLTIHSTNKLILSAAELSMSPITSDLDVQAKLTIERSGSSFNLKSEGIGSGATTYVDFIDANSDSLGYFGYGSGGNTVFYISNNIGDEVRIVGDMNATGSKSAIVETENYGSRKMYAVEAPDVRFMDVIEVTLDQGEHWVNLDQIFVETINGYSVFPIVQSGGQVSILERENQRFKVYVADDNTEVACWVYGKREGYEDIYLEQVEEVA